MTADLDQILRAGTLLILEHGEYSDFNYDAPLRLLKDFTKRELIDSFSKEWEQKDYDSAFSFPNYWDFAAWLVRSGRAEAAENVTTWHLGSYGDFQP